MKIIHVQLSNKGLVPVMPKVFREHILLESLDVFNDERIAIFTPMDDVTIISTLSLAYKLR